VSRIKDLRAFIEFLEERHPHEVVRIRKEVDPRFGVTGILALLEKQNKFPLLIFENVKGSEIPVVANMNASFTRLRLALGMESADPKAYLKEYARREAEPIPPEETETAPVQEVVFEGDEVDVTRLPILTYHELDAAPYITAALNVMQDPDTGGYNIGIYRMMLKDKNTLGILISETAHGNIIWKKYEKRGEPTPLAAVIGHHPAFYLGALQPLAPYDMDEFHVAGGILQQPVRTVQCRTIPLKVPADAEIVLECEVQPHVREAEAPFGEFPGTYGPQRMSPIVKVKAITMRKNPLYQSIFVSHPDNLLLAGLIRANFVEETVKIACPTVTAVQMGGGGRIRFSCYIAIEKMIEGEAKQAAMAAFVADPYLRMVVIVDHDVDVSSDTEVLHALAFRVRPERDTFLVTGAKGSPLDPCSYGPEGGSHLVTKMGIDATRKDGYPQEVSVPGTEGIRLEDYLGDYLSDNPQGVHTR
jgi:2,5-furandicarboxylate decarboxylase 1